MTDDCDARSAAGHLRNGAAKGVGVLCFRHRGDGHLGGKLRPLLARPQTWDRRAQALVFAVAAGNGKDRVIGERDEAGGLDGEARSPRIGADESGRAEQDSAEIARNDNAEIRI